MSISPQSGAMELQRLPSLKYFNVQKWEHRFTLGLDAAKNMWLIQHTYYSATKMEYCHARVYRALGC